MDTWLSLALIIACGLLALYAWKKINTSPDPPKVTNPKQSCISIPSAGGFDRLCHTDALYGLIGANIDGIKPGILTKPITEYDKKITVNLISIQVHAFGLNYADCCIRWGLYESAKKFVGWPICPGFEFSGTVKWIGNPKNTNFKIGDEVFGVSMFGAYSTEVIVPAHQIFHKPKNFTMSEAAAFLCTAFTAYYALFELAAPTLIPHITQSIVNHTNSFFDNGKKNGLKIPKKRALIHSASGGVGSMLAQFCKIAEIQSIVGIVGGQHKIEMAKKMGCNLVIDRKSDKLMKGNIWNEMKTQIHDFDGFDYVFDANGVATLKQSYDYLKPTGKCIVYGFHTMLPQSGSISPLQWIKVGLNLLKTPSFNPLKMVSQNKSVCGFNLSFLFSRTDILQIGMSNVLPWIEEGKIGVCKVTQYKMENVADAHRDIQSGKTIGKLVMITPHHSDYNTI